MQSSVGAGVITAGHARALIALESQAAQEHGLKVVIAKRLSVRQTENWVRTYRPKKLTRGNAPSELRQIAGARNAGARAASGETLVFVDADTLINIAVQKLNASEFGSGSN